MRLALRNPPALSVFHNFTPVEAMKAGFLACLMNIVVFLLYASFMWR